MNKTEIHWKFPWIKDVLQVIKEESEIIADTD